MIENVNLTALFQLMMALIMSVATGAVFISYLKNKSREVLYLVVFFLWVTLYAYTQSLPYYFSGGNPYIVGVGGVIGIAAAFLVQISIFTVTFVRNNDFAQKSKPYFLGWFVLSYAYIAYLAVTDFRLPIVDETPFIFWNFNPLVGWGIAINAMIAGIIFTYSAYSASRYTERKTGKAKAYVLAGDGIAWGVASLFYFPSENIVNTALAFFLAITSFVATAIVFWWVRLNHEGEEKPIETNV